MPIKETLTQTRSSHLGALESTDDLFQPVPCTDSGLSLRLRLYQQLATDGVFDAWTEFDRVLGVAPTGSGKTVIFAHIAARRLEAGPVLILAHRDELLEQARDKIDRSVGICADLEKAETRASLASQIVVGSVQTLCRSQRLNRFPLTHFKTVIVDETHRILAASYLRILEHFGAAKVLGVTATPDRGDKRSLSRFYEAVAFEINLTDLIRDKWLCPIRIKTVPLTIDISRVGMRGGDYSDEELAEALEPVLRELAQAIKEHAAFRKSLIFLPLVRTAYQLAQILREVGLAAEAIHGESPDRKEILDRFRRGETRVLCNAMLLTEGYDNPSIDCVIPLRPTTIRSLYSQLVGRGTRIHPGKENLLILDFLWQSREHNLIRPAALIAKDEVQQVEIEAQLGRAAGDLLAAESYAQDEREAALKARLDERRAERGTEIDILALAGQWQAPDLLNYAPTFDWERREPTAKQQGILHRNGVDPALIRDRGHAAALISALFAHLEREPASIKQKRYLHFLGHPNPWGLTKREAARWISTHKTLTRRGVNY
jgi:superfamily II DNA or RNA helicase